MPLVFALTESLNTSLTEVYSNRAEAKNQETMSIFYLKQFPIFMKTKASYVWEINQIWDSWSIMHS